MGEVELDVVWIQEPCVGSSGAMTSSVFGAGVGLTHCPDKGPKFDPSLCQGLGVAVWTCLQPATIIPLSQRGVLLPDLEAVNTCVSLIWCQDSKLGWF